MRLIDVVRKLIGPVIPVGETRTDEERFENLKQMVQLADLLISEIESVANNKHRPEYSMKLAGKYAEQFLTNLGTKE